MIFNRYRPTIKWSNKSWVHNIFRAYEFVFGRRVGIRAEASYYSDGRVELYSFEATCAYVETIIRHLFRRREWIRVEQFQFANNPYGNSFPKISFAIALDVAATSADSTASPFTWSHTVTGTDPLLAVGVGMAAANQPTTTAITYNSISLTKAQGNQSNPTGQFLESSVWLKGGPSTGANTVSVTATMGISGHAAGVSTSYTGAQSSSTKDASGGATGTATGSQSFTVTTVADNSWVFAVGINMAAVGPTIAANQTSRGTSAVAYSVAAVMRAEDTNGPKTPAGNQTMGFTIGAGATEYGWAMSGASFAPAAGGGGATPTVSTLMMMGV